MNVAAFIDALVFGQLDDDAAGADADLVQKIERAAVEEQLVTEAIRTGIDEQLSRQLQFCETAEYRFTTDLLQLSSQTMPLSGSEKLLRRTQGACRRAADKSFKGDVGMRAKVDDGLKHAGQVTVVDELDELVNFVAASVVDVRFENEKREGWCAFRRVGHDGLLFRSVSVLWR